MVQRVRETLKLRERLAEKDWERDTESDGEKLGQTEILEEREREQKKYATCKTIQKGDGEKDLKTETETRKIRRLGKRLR